MSLALNTESKAQIIFELKIDSYVAGTSQIKDESVFDDIREGFDENAIMVLDRMKRKHSCNFKRGKKI